MSRGWVEILPTPLDADLATASVQKPDVGGIAVFLGTTRAEKNAAGQDLLALDYEAYQEMALAQMRKLADRAYEKWPICDLALLHRIGRVPVKEPSVVIAVSTPHRADAFEGCRWLIDELKKEVAIWKKEVWADGSASWVHPES
jgi:molybdopterin synthase catalytic subunit